MNVIARGQVLPPLPADRNLIRDDAFYTLREAAALTRLKQAELRELMRRSHVRSLTLKDREHILGSDLLNALGAAQ